MARPTMRTMRDNLDANFINKTGLENDQCKKRNILQREYVATGDPAIAAALNQQQTMTDRQKSAKRSAPKSRTNRSTSSRPRRRDFNSPEAFNECGVATGRSYASRAGERMEKNQEGFPDVMRHPTTINNMILPLDTTDAQEMLDSCRPRMRDTFSLLSEGAQISGGFQIAMETAAYLATIFPEDELPDCLDPVNRPDEVFALLHWHGIIADPYLTKKEVREIVRDAFPGSRRVCVARVQPEKINKHGEVTHGAQGYLEYAYLDKTEVKFKKPEQKKDGIIGFARLGYQLNKRSRSFSMGKSLSVTGVEINPARVIELQVLDRLDYVRKNFEKMTFAEQFIHLWFSGVVSLIRKPQPWLQCTGSITDRFLAFLSLTKKWCADTSAENTCFYGYAEAALE